MAWSSVLLAVEVAPPTLSHFGGSYRSVITVIASTTTGGATIRYTLNGAVPTESDTIISGAGLAINGTQVVRVRAFAAGMTPSAVTNSWFRVGPQVARGADFAFALSSGGALWSWGANDFGQLGDGQTVGVVEPRLVQGGITTVDQISGGFDHTLAVTSDGKVWTWGCNVAGQLGTGTTTNRSLPAALSATGVRAVAAGLANQGHSLASTAGGAVLAWGVNSYGQLGDASNVSRLTPVTVTGLANVAGVTAGENCSIAWDRSGSVWSWGYGGYGTLGLDTATTSSTTPVRLTAISDVVQVQAGLQHVIALRADGTVWAWGKGVQGQLGLGAGTTYKYLPNQVPGLSNIVAIAAGLDQGYAVGRDGRVWAWGSNINGEIGDGTTTNRLTPWAVAGVTNAAYVQAGSGVVVIRQDGSLVAWGQNNVGQLGNGVTAPSQLSPASLSFTLQPQVAKPTLSHFGGYYRAGATVTAATTTGGATLRYTTNGAEPSDTDATVSGGIVITGTQVIRVRGFAAGMAPSQTTSAWYRVGPTVASGNDFAFALATSGQLSSWGANDYGQLGDGQTSTVVEPRPLTTITNVAQIAGGFDHTLAVTSDGKVWTWGYNGYGQLGSGTTTNRSLPGALSLTSMRSVAAGLASAGHSVATHTDGSVRAWGYNVYGQLGDGTTSDRLAPVTVPGLAGIAGVTATENCTLAWDRDGVMWSWGYGGYGTLGLEPANSTTTSPKRLGGITAVVQAQAGYQHVVALRADGTVWTWGRGTQGQLGLGAGANYKYVPNQVPGLPGIIAVAAGMDQGYAVGRDGSLWSWGINTNGELGDGSTTNRLSPVRVPGVSGAVYVQAGTGVHVIRQDGSVMSWGQNNLGQLGIGTVGTPQVSAAPMALTFQAQVARPTMNPPGGYYRAGATVTVTTATAGATLRYTTNGAEPTDTDTVVPGGGIVMSGTQVLRVRGFLTGQAPSVVSSAWYRTGATVASGRDFHFVLSAGGTLASWGDNQYGQLGDGQRVAVLDPRPIALTGVNLIAAGNEHSLATTSAVQTWGRNDAGQLGTGTTVDRALPGALSLAAIRSLVSGRGESTRAFSLAVANDGSLWVWGANNVGQLGDGTTTDRSAPFKVTGITGMIAVAATGASSLALDGGGMVWSWGQSSYGALGLGNSISSAARPQRVGGIGDIIQLSGGEDHVVALRADGTVWTWGDGQSGQLGVGPSPTASSIPLQVPGLTDVIAVAAGLKQSFALLRDGTLKAWGSNQFGALGDGTTVHQFLPIDVPGVRNVAMVQAGTSVVVLRQDGSLQSWGRNQYGQLGVGTIVDRPTVSTITTFTLQSQVAKPVLGKLGGYYRTGVTVTATSGTSGATLRYTTNGNEPSDTDATVPGGGVVISGTQILRVRAFKSGMAPSLVSSAWYRTGGTIACGDDFSFALSASGTLSAWGRNDSGQLGDGQTVRILEPRQLSAISAVDQISGGFSHSLAVVSGGTMWSWGNNDSTQLGAGAAIGAGRLLPAATTVTGMRAVAASRGQGYLSADRFGLASTTAGAVWSWGSNSYGQLGDGTTNPRDLPAAVPGLSNISGISAGPTSAFAWDRDGIVWAWGVNGYSCLGLGQWVYGTNSPQRIGGIRDVVQLQAGHQHVVALCGDGTVWTWGDNGTGQLGHGSTVYSLNAPQQVAGLSGVVSIAASPQQSFAVKRDGTVWGWGNNWHGAVGVSGEGIEYVPVQVPGVTGAALVQAGSNVLVIKSDGSLMGWGENYWGQVGVGTGGVDNIRVAPQAIGGGFTTLSQVAAPVLSPPPGYLRGGATVTASSATSGTTLRYTLDGSEPTSSSTTFPGTGLAISGTQVLRVRGFKSGLAASVTTSGRYQTGPMLSLASEVSFSLSASGGVAAWGLNDQSQLGLPRPSPMALRPVVMSGIPGFNSISAASTYTLGVAQDGGVWSWGYNNTYGQMAIPEQGGRPLPGPVALGGIRDVSAGSYHALALAQDGSVWAWGYNGEGGLGDGTTTGGYTPVRALGIGNVTQVLAGFSEGYSLALDRDGWMWSWGMAQNAQMAQGGDSSYCQTPTRTVKGGMVALAAGQLHVLGLGADGSVWSWGRNTRGQCGVGVVGVTNTVPVKIPGLGNIITIAAIGESSFALTRTGAVYAWGANDGGILGAGGGDRVVPTLVAGIPALQGIAVGGNIPASGQVVGWDATGVLWSWGVNTSGQTGRGIASASATPVAIGKYFRAAPSGLQAWAASATSVLLEWQRDLAAASHEIQRRAVGATPWDVIGFARPGANHYVDRTVLAGTTYEYRVRDKTGDNSARFSGIVSVTGSAAASTASVVTANPGPQRTVEGAWPVQLDGSASGVTRGDALNQRIERPWEVESGDQEMILKGGTGGFLRGDAVQFPGSNADYAITDLAKAGDGRIRVVLEPGANAGAMQEYAPGQALINAAGDTIGTMASKVTFGARIINVSVTGAVPAIGDVVRIGHSTLDHWYRVTSVQIDAGSGSIGVWPQGALTPIPTDSPASVSTEILTYNWSWRPDGLTSLPLSVGVKQKRSLRGTDSDPWAYATGVYRDEWGRPLGTYPITLQVVDSAGKTAAVDWPVVVTKGTAPVANAGGPYEGGVGGPPVFFNGSQSSDDFGIVDYWWDVNTSVNSDGVGTASDDRDLYGRFPMFTYSAAGTYQAKLTVIDGAGQSSSATVAVVVSSNLAPQVSCIPFRGNPTAYHPVLSGAETTLKARVRDAGALTARWDFGDGTNSGAAAAIPSAWAVEAKHTYSGNAGAKFTATLTVTDAQAQVSISQYLVEIKANTLDVREQIAVDAGLWFLHKAKGNTGVTGGWTVYQDTADSRLGAGWPEFRSERGPLVPSASAVQAFCLHGSRPDGEPRSNPYAETADQGLKFIYSLLIKDPDYAANYQSTSTTNGFTLVDANGIGIDGGNQGTYATYETGPVMDAIAATEAPLAVVWPPSAVSGRRQLDIMRDMIDLQSWGQCDDGGWRYLWNNNYNLFFYSSDNSASQWPVIGFLAAQQVFGLWAQDWVSAENEKWVASTFDATRRRPQYFNNTGFATMPDFGTGTAPSSLVQWNWRGIASTGTAWKTVELWMRENWGNYFEAPTPNRLEDYPEDPLKLRTYASYGVVKAMRLSNPRPTVLLGGGFDWWNDPNDGLRVSLVRTQEADGSWEGKDWFIGNHLGTAWPLIMFSPTIFTEDRRWYPNRAPVVRAKSVTVTAETGKATAPVTAGQLNDGCFDLDDDPITLRLSPTGPYPVGTTTVTFTVTDPAGLSSSAVVNVTVLDKEKPTITNLAAVTVPTNPGANIATGVKLGYPLAKDNVGIASVTNNAPATFPLGATTVVWTVKDPSNNTTTYNQTVTVVDQESPRITPPNTQVVYVATAGATASGVDLGTPVTSDNVGVTSVTNNAPTSYPVGSTSVTWTARDAAGNQAQATQTVEVKVSSNAPTITLSSPGNGTSFLAGSTLSITAFASNVQAGDVLKVEFFYGAVKIGEDLTAPYSQSWPSVPLGTHQLTARATLRTGGNSTNPASVTSTLRTITVVNTTTVQGAAP